MIIKLNIDPYTKELVKILQKGINEGKITKGEAIKMLNCVPQLSILQYA